ncbi:sulfurtransferase complex subunit TusC [Enterobacteriaceae endosymbiont of Donacia thalassina]|uniref:sulfurtransferase complex subunit TusC n=1 Tax=Enterobacteriaceae endosymbiont of Donacia thalassina TaxID=2675786 RepID=UPI00144A1DCE|nr:sulfurtransferase complex subunit TusC [Enterobacteriaceae endosymbiont of Donacia thalassina]QJC37430.1 sulfurtransferase complex subunit TusC [Enterobacteriaceae endosymbiont of Donacia thalassina]
MNKIAFIFSRSPYGNSIGKEGLDAVISISSLTEDIALFFIGDGILQIQKQQETKNFLLKNYNISFSVLKLCNINNYFVCSKSLKILGIKYNKNNWVIPIKIINPSIWQKIINTYNIVINF